MLDNKYNLSPRKQFCDAYAGSDKKRNSRNFQLADLEEDYIKTSDGLTTLPPRDAVYDPDFIISIQQACLMLMDTEREREIGLGSMYKFDAMSEGQCLVSQEFANQLKIKKGDIMYVQMYMY